MEKDIIRLYKELSLARKETHCQKAIGWHVNIHKAPLGTFQLWGQLVLF